MGSSLGISVQHGADRLDLVIVEFSATEATQYRHRASDLSMNVTRVGRYQNLYTGHSTKGKKGKGE